MSIAQFDPNSIKGAAAQIGAVAAKSTADGNFARLLNDAQTQNTIEKQRQAAASAPAAPPQAAKHAASTAAKPSPTKAAPNDDTTDKTHDGHRAGHHEVTTADAQSAAPIVIPPSPLPAPTPTAAAPATTDATDADGDGATAQAAATTQAAGPAATAADATPDPAVSGPGTSTLADTTIAAPSLATLAALGLGRGAAPGIGTSGAPANGKATASAVTVSVTKAPVAVKLGSLTTGLPLDLDGQTAEPVAAAAAPVASPTTASTNAASAAAAATDQAVQDAAAPPLTDPAPVDLAAALTAAATTIVSTEPPPMTTTAGADQHASLFAQGGDATTAPSALGNGATPTMAGFATVNAGTAVSRAETASDTTPGNQNSQTPLPLPAEQLAVAIARNAGVGGGQNFTIRLSPEKLGSVEVRLQVDAKGKTTANFVVEHAETLHLLKLDSQQLVQSLQNAGVDTNGASLSFSLRDPNMGQAQNQQTGTPGSQTGRLAALDNGADAVEQPTIASHRLYDIKA
ncbi:MAG TPA: flagellar hook-length control protein FliK [Aliidongia sp.]|uniref:flagellar hook-length control protein FliK n=1 Tax=Aliidongia sp. TaxID=1914230 RepID=UPI002DDCEA92|nr:flagellar hook-length control protein FliK [Aliidongia sp.]HEV2674064.1 flagellar hook-length control protein FliK [Aliidongia sp.]